MGSPLQTVSDAGIAGPLTRFDPYGGLRAGSAPPGPVGFTGEWSDASGLLNLRARAYDPSFGRFLSQDSFGGFAALPASGNRYAYAWGNPLRFVDPSGHSVNAVIDSIREHPGEAVSLALGLVSARGWGLYAMASALVGVDLATWRHLSTEERFVYGALGAVSFATSLPLRTMSRQVLGLARAVAGESRLFGAGARLFGRTAGALRGGVGALERTVARAAVSLRGAIAAAGRFRGGARVALGEGPGAMLAREANVVPRAVARTITIDAERFGQAAEHLRQACGSDFCVTYHPAGAVARRSANLERSGLPPQLLFDRDEAPMAVFAESTEASVRYVDRSSNRSLGAYIGRYLQGLRPGDIVRILILGNGA